MYTAHKLLDGQYVVGHVDSPIRIVCHRRDAVWEPLYGVKKTNTVVDLPMCFRLKDELVAALDRASA